MAEDPMRATARRQAELADEARKQTPAGKAQHAWEERSGLLAQHFARLAPPAKAERLAAARIHTYERFLPSKWWERSKSYTASEEKYDLAGDGWALHTNSGAFQPVHELSRTTYGIRDDVGSTKKTGFYGDRLVVRSDGRLIRVVRLAIPGVPANMSRDDGAMAGVLVCRATQEWKNLHPQVPSGLSDWSPSAVDGLSALGYSFSGSPFSTQQERDSQQAEYEAQWNQELLASAGDRLQAAMVRTLLALGAEWTEP